MNQKRVSKTWNSASCATCPYHQKSFEIQKSCFSSAARPAAVRLSTVAASAAAAVLVETAPTSDVHAAQGHGDMDPVPVQDGEEDADAVVEPVVAAVVDAAALAIEDEAESESVRVMAAVYAPAPPLCRRFSVIVSSPSRLRLVACVGISHLLLSVFSVVGVLCRPRMGLVEV